MEPTLRENLRHAMALDRSVRRGEPVEKIVATALASLILQPDPDVRRAAVNRVEAKVVHEWAAVIQPAARQIGTDAARRVMRIMGAAPAPLAPGAPVPPTGAAPSPGAPGALALRRAAVDAALRPAPRTQIVQRVVNDKANTLLNRADAYYLEPGQSTPAKVAHMRAVYAEQERARREYEAADEAYRAGRLDARPRRPRLDYASAFVFDAKQGLREQARRAGTDAETAVYARAGVELLKWKTTQGRDACPQCRERDGWVGDAAFWDAKGRPGTGCTYCGTHCWCFLIPATLGATKPRGRTG